MYLSGVWKVTNFVTCQGGDKLVEGVMGGDKFVRGYGGDKFVGGMGVTNLLVIVYGG